MAATTNKQTNVWRWFLKRLWCYIYTYVSDSRRGWNNPRKNQIGLLWENLKKGKIFRPPWTAVGGWWGWNLIYMLMPVTILWIIHFTRHTSRGSVCPPQDKGHVNACACEDNLQPVSLGQLFESRYDVTNIRITSTTGRRCVCRGEINPLF